MMSDAHHRRKRRAATGFAILLSGLGCRGDNASGDAGELGEVNSDLGITEVWRSGDVHEYHLDMMVRVEIGSPPPEFDFSLSGTVELAVLYAGGSGASFQLRFPTLTGEDRSPDTQRNLDATILDLRKATAFFNLEGGRLSELRVGGVTEIAANVFRLVASSFQFAPGKGTRSAEEYDTTGRFVAEYRPSDRECVVEKRKVRYLALLGGDEKEGGLRVLPRILEGQMGITLGTSGVPDGVTSQDEVVIEGTQVAVHSRVTMAMRRVQTLHDMPVADALAMREGLRPIRPGEPLVSRITPGTLDYARVQNLSFSQVLAELEAQADRLEPRNAKSPPERREPADVTEGRSAKLFSALVAHFRLNGATIAKAERIIRRHSPITPVLVDGLSSAGSPACHAALARLFKDPSILAETRSGVLQALARTRRPDELTVSIMRAVLANDPYNQRALFALGTYSRLFRDSGEARMATEIGEELVSKLQDAPGPTGTVSALRAIANSGYAGALSRVEPYLSAVDETTRASAVRALQSIPGARVDMLIAQRVASDSASAVRISALAAAGVRPPSDLLVAALKNASGSGDTRVRFRVVELAERWLSLVGDLSRLLEKIANTDVDLQIQARARTALSKPRTGQMTLWSPHGVE